MRLIHPPKRCQLYVLQAVISPCEYPYLLAKTIDRLPQTVLFLRTHDHYGMVPPSPPTPTDRYLQEHLREGSGLRAGPDHGW